MLGAQKSKYLIEKQEKWFSMTYSYPVAYRELEFLILMVSHQLNVIGIKKMSRSGLQKNN